MNFLFCCACVLAISQLSAAAIPFLAFEEAAPFFPFLGAPLAPGLPPPVAFNNGPIFTSVIPSLHPLYGTPRFEVRNIIRSSDRDTVNFSGSSHRTLEFPFAKKL